MSGITVTGTYVSSRFSVCPCCESDEFETFYLNEFPRIIYRDTDFFFGSREFINTLVSCNRCEFKFQNTMPSEYLKFYSSFDDIPPDHYRSIKEDYFRRLKNVVLEHLLTGDNIKSIVDIGAGDGTWLDQWSEVPERSASEASEKSLSILGKKDIRIVGVDEWQGEQFSMLSMLDFLEHVEDPLVALREVYSSIEDGGYLIVSVPKMDKIISRILREKYYLYCPMHVSYFTTNSLFSILSKFFQNDQISVFDAPSHRFSIKMAARWLHCDNLIPKWADFVCPIGYSANLVAVCKK